jgi:ribulose-5-phosphate 4-epimerase/fuculose-1-phosphate aldolase
MTINEIKEQVITAGKKLVEAGLIARTWGNVSSRVDASHFAVTPSGRTYESLGLEDIVVVDAGGLSYSGSVRPSSETGIHAAIYNLKPKANFVIHTHQPYASVVSALPRAEQGSFFCAAYGLPGSEKLRQGVIDVLGRSDCKSIIMAHHGALCYGGDEQEAFEEALALERRCEAYIMSLRKSSGARCVAKRQLCQSRRSAAGIRVWSGAAEYGEASPEWILHKAIYSGRNDIHCILHGDLPELVCASNNHQEVWPLLDDFAQIIGVSLKIAAWDPSDPENAAAAILKALAGRHAVLIEGSGALCCGATLKDADAVLSIAEKGCMASNTAMELGCASSIDPAECRLMRQNYLKNYSKRAENL